MFWTDHGVTDKIEMSTMAGENRKVLVSENLQEPRGITVDYTSDRYVSMVTLGLEEIIKGANKLSYLRNGLAANWPYMTVTNTLW